MTSSERAGRESGYEADGVTAFGFHIPKGTRVAVKLPAGRWVWHVTKRDIVTGRGDSPTNQNHPIDPRMTRDLYDIGTTTVDGYEVRYVRNIPYYGGIGDNDLPRCQDVSYREHPCLCDGKGEIEVGLYGRLKGCRWRVKCGKRCTWKKPSRKTVA